MHMLIKWFLKLFLLIKKHIFIFNSESLTIFATFYFGLNVKEYQMAYDNLEY